MILVGIGSNLAAPPAETPLQTAVAALDALPNVGIDIERCSKWYLSEPVPASDQPWFVNGVVAVASTLTPAALLERLLAVERDFARVRSVPNAARTLDLDLLDYESRIRETTNLILPHPRLHLRRFVLEPLCEIAPDWPHPTLGLTARDLLARLPPGQPVRRIDD